MGSRRSATEVSEMWLARSAIVLGWNAFWHSTTLRHRASSLRAGLSAQPRCWRHVFLHGHLVDRDRPLLMEDGELLRASVRRVRDVMPFHIDARVVLAHEARDSNYRSLPENKAIEGARYTRECLGIVRVGSGPCRFARRDCSRVNPGFRFRLHPGYACCLPHRLAAAFRAISRRRTGDIASARAAPPFLPNSAAAGSFPSSTASLTWPMAISPISLPSCIGSGGGGFAWLPSGLYIASETSHAGYQTQSRPGDAAHA